MKRLKEELAAAREVSGGAEGARRKAEEGVQVAEGELEEAWRVLREAEDAYRSATAEVQAQSDRKARLDRHQEELARQLEGTRAARDRALERARAAREDREVLQEETRGLAAHEGNLREGVSETQEAWEEARAAESQVSLELARKEGDHARLRERLTDLDASLKDARSRTAALSQEEASLREQRESAARLKEEGSAATEALFREQDQAEKALREREEASALVTESLQEADRRVRTARAEEREALDRRHRLELEQQELTGRIGRIQDRLEGEWGRSLDVLMGEAEPVEGDPD